MQQQQQQQQPPQYYAGNEGMGLGMGGMQQQQPVVDPDDPLLIAQSLTYVTDDGSVLLSYQSAPFSTCKCSGGGGEIARSGANLEIEQLLRCADIGSWLQPTGRV